MVFTGADYEKFRTLRITHVARAFEHLITDEANDGLLPEQLGGVKWFVCRVSRERT